MRRDLYFLRGVRGRGELSSKLDFCTSFELASFTFLSNLIEYYFKAIETLWNSFQHSSNIFTFSKNGEKINSHLAMMSIEIQVVLIQKSSFEVNLDSVTPLKFSLKYVFFIYTTCVIIIHSSKISQHLIITYIFTFHNSTFLHFSQIKWQNEDNHDNVVT